MRAPDAAQHDIVATDPLLPDHRIAFRGADILDAVLAELVAGREALDEAGLPPLADADTVVLAGTSAGALGLALRVDRLADTVRTAAPSAPPAASMMGSAMPAAMAPPVAAAAADDFFGGFDSTGPPAPPPPPPVRGFSSNSPGGNPFETPPAGMMAAGNPFGGAPGGMMGGAPPIGGAAALPAGMFQPGGAAKPTQSNNDPFAGLGGFGK